MRNDKLGKTTFISILCLLMAWVSVGHVWGQTSEPWDGTSTEADWASDYNPDESEQTFEISTPAQLAQLAQMVNEGKSFNKKIIKLHNDIDLNNKEWTPIGKDENHSFQGTFDGANLTISNMTITGNTGHIGLFGCNGGTIKNLGITGNSSITVIGENTKTGSIGSIAGYNGHIIENCYNTGNISVTGMVRVGGIAGENNGTVASIRYCYNTGRVSRFGNEAVTGGIVGVNEGSYHRA